MTADHDRINDESAARLLALASRAPAQALGGEALREVLAPFVHDENYIEGRFGIIDDDDDAVESASSFEQAIELWRECSAREPNERFSITGWNHATLVSGHDAERLFGPLKGTYECPLCGKAEPHEHSGAEIADHRSHEQWMQQNNEKQRQEILRRAANVNKNYGQRPNLDAAVAAVAALAHRATAQAPEQPGTQRVDCTRCDGRGYFDGGSECGRCNGHGFEPAAPGPARLTAKQVIDLYHQFGTGRLDGFAAAIRKAEEMLAGAAPTPVEPAKRYGDLTGTFADKTNTFQPPVAQSLEAPEGSGAATQDAKGEPQERQVSNLRQSPDRQCDTGSACVLASAPGDPFVEPGNPANQAPVPSDEQIDAAWFKLPVARTAGGLTDLFAHRIQFARAVLALLSPPIGREPSRPGDLVPLANGRAVDLGGRWTLPT